MATLRSSSISGKGKISGGRISDVAKGRMTTDEKLDNIWDMLSSLKEDMNCQIERLREELKEENRELIERYESRLYDLEVENGDLKFTVSKLEKQLLESDERYLNLENKHNKLYIFGKD